MNGAADLLNTSSIQVNRLLLGHYFPEVPADQHYLIGRVACLFGNVSARFSSPDIDFEYLRKKNLISSSLESCIQNFRNNVRLKVVFEVFRISGEEYAFVKHPQANIWYAVTNNVQAFSPVRSDLEEVLRTNSPLSRDEVEKSVGFSWWNRALPVFFVVLGVLSMFLFPVFCAGGHATIGSVSFVTFSILGGRLLLSIGQRGLSDARAAEREEVRRILDFWHRRREWIEGRLVTAR